MTFPITIQDQQELNRFARTMAIEMAPALAEQILIRFGKLTEWVKKAEAVRIIGSERKVNKAQTTGELPYVMKGKNIMFLRSDINKYQLKHTL